MKKIILLPLALSLSACGLNNYDDVAYRQVITTPPPANKYTWVTNRESMDMTNTSVRQRP